MIYSIILILAGILAGFVNFFISYVNLPFSSKPLLEDAGNGSLKDIWWVALLGYVIVGISGSFLTLVINAIVNGLKGFDTTNPFFNFTLFGYGLIFGFSANKLLVSIVDSVIKRLLHVESDLNLISRRNSLSEKNTLLNNFTSGSAIIDSCERHFDDSKNDCSGFVKAVAKDFSVVLDGQADDIIVQIKGESWNILSDGKEAKAKADKGWLVVGGLTSTDNVPPQTHGHVVIIVSGRIERDKYPSAYWGSLNGNTVAAKNKTINWAWNKESRDKVIFFAKQVSSN